MKVFKVSLRFTATDAADEHNVAEAFEAVICQRHGVAVPFEIVNASVESVECVGRIEPLPPAGAEDNGAA